MELKDQRHRRSRCKGSSERVRAASEFQSRGQTATQLGGWREHGAVRVINESRKGTDERARDAKRVSNCRALSSNNESFSRSGTRLTAVNFVDRLGARLRLRR